MCGETEMFPVVALELLMHRSHGAVFSSTSEHGLVQDRTLACRGVYITETVISTLSITRTVMKPAIKKTVDGVSQQRMF